MSGKEGRKWIKKRGEKPKSLPRMREFCIHKVAN
jgi:hypothetical protein